MNTFINNAEILLAIYEDWALADKGKAAMVFTRVQIISYCIVTFLFSLNLRSQWSIKMFITLVLNR
jgi:hypothetical protein